MGGNIGDINSPAMGSGARYSQGKPPLDLLPLGFIAKCMLIQKPFNPLGMVMAHLAQFQQGAKEEALFSAIEGLGGSALDIAVGAAKVFDFGRAKYAEWNWAKGMSWSVPIACAARHLLYEWQGEVNDPESELPHRDHAICNLLMLLQYLRTYPEGDDRPVYLKEFGLETTSKT